MNKLDIDAFAIAISLAFSAGAMAQTLSNDQSGEGGIAAEHATADCASFSGDEHDKCAAEASGKEEAAKPERNTSFKPSEGALYEVRVSEANADYSVAKEKCDDKAGHLKKDCVKEAKATSVATKADAKVRMKTANAKQKAAKTSAKAKANDSK